MATGFTHEIAQKNSYRYSTEDGLKQFFTYTKEAQKHMKKIFIGDGTEKVQEHMVCVV